MADQEKEQEDNESIITTNTTTPSSSSSTTTRRRSTRNRPKPTPSIYEEQYEAISSSSKKDKKDEERPSLSSIRNSVDSDSDDDDELVDDVSVASTPAPADNDDMEVEEEEDLLADVIRRRNKRKSLTSEKDQQESESETDDNHNSESDEPQEDDSQKEATESDDNHKDVEESEEEMSTSSSSSEDDSDDEDFDIKRPQRKKAITSTTPTKPKKSTKKNHNSKQSSKVQTKSPRRIQVLLKSPTNTNNKNVTRQGRNNLPPGQRPINNALANLAKKVLDKSEYPPKQQQGNTTANDDTTFPPLVTSLLTSYQTKTTQSSSSTTSPLPKDSSWSQPVTVYTPQLETTARKLIELHNVDSNLAQIHLLNLLFRSVGGTVDTNLHIPNKNNTNKEKEDDISEEEEEEEEVMQLEEMDDEDWVPLITNLVDTIRLTNADCILICADPDGAVHAGEIDEKGLYDVGSVVQVTKGSLGVRVFRKIFEEFWYVLGSVALNEGSMASGTMSNSTIVDDDDDEEEEEEGSERESEEEEDDIESSSVESEERPKKKKKTKKTTKTKKSTKHNKKQGYTHHGSGVDTELIQELLNRVMELVSVGQPDVRAAATNAAIFMVHAIVDKTVFLGEKLNRATRQFAAAVGSSNKKNKRVGNSSSTTTSEKIESLRHQIDSLKRTRTTLEEIVLGPFVEGVFVHRFRDSNMFIRASCLNALSRMMIRRPDVFLIDKFLKFFGWMISDKTECARMAALEGLMKPFETIQSAEDSGNKCDIELSALEHVVTKFQDRIVDCVIDVSVGVQEKGIKFLLALLRTGFLDDVEDENIWNQINLRALDNDTSPEVRRLALYFIMEQLEAFDEDAVQDSSRSSSSSSKAKKNSDRRTAQRLDAIASWAAHALTDGQVPIEKIQIHLVNHLVHSLREMPEHKDIVTNWSAMLKAIMDDNVALTAQGTIAGDRADVAKQRVLIQILANAAKTEVSSVTDSTFHYQDADFDAAKLLEKNLPSKQKGGKDSNKNLQHENLSVALLKTLPNLLSKFLSDTPVLESLTCLPRYLLPTVFSLPQRKSDFLLLLKNLSEIFMQSSDEEVLQNTACSLIYLCKGNHARSTEAKVTIQKTVKTLSDRISTLLSNEKDEKKDEKDESSSKASKESSPRRSRRSISSQQRDSLSVDSVLDDNSLSEEDDIEHALYLSLKRFRVLIKRMDITESFESNDDDEVDTLETFCNTLADGIAHRLAERKAVDADGDINDTWGGTDEKYPLVVGGIVREGLEFLLMISAWKVLDIQKAESLVVEDDSEEKMDVQTEKDNEVDDHFILRLRNRLISLAELCFDQFLPEQEESTNYSQSQVIWSDIVQEIGGKLASDLRTLFHREWANAASPFLRAFALTDDSRLIGGFVRYFRSKEEELRENGDSNEEGEDKDSIRTLLLTLGRSVVINWKDGNRREAGVALSHITGSGPEASHVVRTLSRMLKKVESVRLLEAHMASLRQSYEDWIDNDPEEIENDHPTDEEMAAFSDAEAKHEGQFQILVNQAHRFSMSLGLRKLSDEKLSPALLGFLREGIRYAFSSSEDLVLGSRLSFLSILNKYGHWMKRNKEFKRILNDDLEKKETEIKADPEFDEVHEDDLKALALFRISIGLKESNVLTFSSSATVSVHSTLDSQGEEEDDDETRDMITDIQSPASTSRKSTSMGHANSSVDSIRSVISSNRGSLSPLYEEDGNEEDAEYDSPPPTESVPSQASPEKRGTKRASESSGLYESQITFDGEISSDGSMNSNSQNSSSNKKAKTSSS